jgi:hypothetical protein
MGTKRLVNSTYYADVISTKTYLKILQTAGQKHLLLLALTVLIYRKGTGRRKSVALFN